MIPSLLLWAGLQEPAVLELEPLPERVWAGQELSLRIRFGFEADFLERNLLQPFRRPLELPAVLRLGWKDAVPAPEPDGPTCSIDGRVERVRDLGEEEREGRRFRLFGLERRLVAGQAGPLELPGPELRWYAARRFREDPIQGRQPVEREPGRIAGAPIRLQVQPLPEEGRPPAFAGAVGDFRIQAELLPNGEGRTAGEEPVRVRVEIQGEGNLAGLPAPDLSDLPGFHLLGWLEEEAPPGRRRFLYEFLAEERTGSLPEIEFVFFDPRGGHYRTARTEPLPLPSVGGAPPARPAGPAAPETEAEGARPPFGRLLVFALAAIGFLLLRRRSSPSDPVANPSAEPDPAASASAPPDLERVLADRLGCPEPALIRPDLDRLLVAAGLDQDLARRAAALLRARIEARYGGPPVDPEAEAAVLAELGRRSQPRP